MELTVHYRLARIVFWFAQAIGVSAIILLLLFIGGSLIGELIEKVIDIRTDYLVFLFFLCELCIAVSFAVSWYRLRLGAVLVISFTILVSILWGREDINIILLHLPLVLSGLILLFYSYYREWILKKMP